MKFLMKMKHRWIEILLVLLFLGQLLVLLYFNFTQLRNHIGYDSSWVFFKSTLMWKEKAVFSHKWMDTTNAQVDTPAILAALLYGITGHPFFSYGLANTIILSCILIVMWRVLTLLGVDLISRLIAVNMIICPYLTNYFSTDNDLGYFNCTLSGAAFYSLRVLLALLIIYEFVYINKQNKFNVLAVITLLLCAFSGASCGLYILAVILLPYLVFELEMVFINDDLRQLISKESIFAFAGCASVILGKIVAEKFWGVSTIETSKPWNNLMDFWKNVGMVISGFMRIFGVLPPAGDVYVMPDGVYYVFPIVVFAVAVISIIYAFKTAKKNVSDNKMLIFFLNILAVNFAMFSLIRMTYADVVFEERYLITSFMAVIILVANLCTFLDKQKLFSKFLFLALFISLLGTNFVSDTKYMEVTNDWLQMEEIVGIADSHRVGLVYLWGGDLTHTCWPLRAYDMNHVYKSIMEDGGFHHWGEYLHYEDSGEFNGRTLLITRKDVSISDLILEKYDKVQDLDNMSVYYCDHNAIDFVVAGYAEQISGD